MADTDSDSTDSDTTDSDSTDSDEELQVVTHQPKKSSSAPSDGEEVVTQQPKKKKSSAPSDDDGDKSSFEREGPSVEIEFDPFDWESCVSVSAGCGSASREYLHGHAKAEYVGPNVACVLNCSECPAAVITDWTFELCSANFVFGHLLCTLGLALDTKLIFTPDGVETEICGSGMETSEGIAFAMFGSKIGIAKMEKREKKWAKKKWKWGTKKVKPEEEETSVEDASEM